MNINKKSNAKHFFFEMIGNTLIVAQKRKCLSKEGNRVSVRRKIKNKKGTRKLKKLIFDIIINKQNRMSPRGREE